MNPIDRGRQRSEARPQWAHLIALELDQALTQERAAHLVTIARHGTCAAAPGIPPAGAEGKSTDTLARAARLLARGDRWGALRLAYEHARGEEIHACNLLYANASVAEEDVWLHFLNKYLARFGSGPLTLAHGSAPRVLRLGAAGTSAADRVQASAGVPLVSVLMPARNAARTLDAACRSILGQTWAAIELIVVDDASDDDTWSRLLALASADDRVRPLRLARAAGPYVARNVALSHARGRYLTCHDADDWALPQRIERQLQPLLADPATKVSVARMLRVAPDGLFTRFAPAGDLTHDGALRRAYVSPLIEKAYFERHLGAWDAVRFGADSELLARIERFAASRRVDLVEPVLLALDAPDGLTRHADSSIGEDGRVNEARAAYQAAWQAWQRGHARMPRLGFPLQARAFDAPAGMTVALDLQTQPVGTPDTVAAAATAATARPSVPLRRALPTGQTLWRASQRLEGGEPAAEVLGDAEREAGDDERAAVDLLRANVALDDEEAWLDAVNRYLRAHGVQPLLLRPLEATRFWRIHAEPPHRVEHGPLVSVIMPAFQAEASLAFAARSILAQTWRPLELIIVDDASDDRTFAVATELARADDRVRVLRNRANVGPYVSKNFGLQVARGAFVTGHDADDWAHPERIERQLRAMLASGGAQPANLMGMLRTEASGRFSRASKVTVNSLDGMLQAAFISAFFDAEFLRRKLGHWDEARFAGDSEMINRAQRVIGAELPRLHCPGLVCLDSPTGLTNHPEHGYSPTRGLSDSRKAYRDAFNAWHATLDAHGARLDFPQRVRRFPVPDAARVDPEALRRCVEGHRTAIGVASAESGT